MPQKRRKIYINKMLQPEDSNSEEVSPWKHQASCLIIMLFKNALSTKKKLLGVAYFGVATDNSGRVLA